MIKKQKNRNFLINYLFIMVIILYSIKPIFYIIRNDFIKNSNNCYFFLKIYKNNFYFFIKLKCIQKKLIYKNKIFLLKNFTNIKK